MPTLELTRDQIVAEMNRVSQLRLGLPVDEVMRRYRGGELADPGEVADLLILADLLDPNDPLSAN